MKDFPNAAFAPEAIKTMTTALEASVAMLPEPVSLRHVHRLAETILRETKPFFARPRTASTTLPFCNGWRCWNCRLVRAIDLLSRFSEPKMVPATFCFLCRNFTPHQRFLLHLHEERRFA
jgi:hypothetical protein